MSEDLPTRCREEAKRLDDSIGTDEQLASVLLRESADEIERLRAIVDKLPKTADGVPVYHGMKLWGLTPVVHKTFYWVFHRRRITHFTLHEIAADGSVDCIDYAPEDCYSTREAAEAAEGE